MKLTPYLKHKCTYKRTYVIYIFLFLYSLNIFFRKITAASNTELYYSIYYNIFSSYTVTFLLIPLLLLLVDQNLCFFDNVSIILNMKSKKSWWKIRVKYLFLDLLLFTIFTNILVFFPMLILNQITLLNINLIITTLELAFLQFSGYGVLGILFISVTILSGRKQIGFIVPFVLVLSDLLFLQRGVNVNILTNYMFLYNGQITIFLWLLRFSYLIALFFFIYLMSIYFVENKDFIDTIS